MPQASCRSSASARADYDANLFRACSACRRSCISISAEPLFEALDLARFLSESGAGFRAMELDWVRGIRDQCAAAGVAFFHKQGEHRYPGRDVELDGRLEHAWPKTV